MTLFQKIIHILLGLCFSYLVAALVLYSEGLIGLDYLLTGLVLFLLLFLCTVG
jgi:uncharacterized protein YggT (Ycf19 family)